MYVLAPTLVNPGKNDLPHIPEAIGNLTSLRELNLSGNHLQFLPHTLLDLNQLQHLRLHPNPFLSPPASYSPLPTPPSSQVNAPAVLRAYQRPTRPKNTASITSLVEFASRALAETFVLADIDKAFELPEYLHDKAHHAEERFKWHDTCSICTQWYVDGPVDENGMGCIEYYDSLHANDAVPVWRGVCSWQCVEKWEVQCQHTLGEQAKQK